MVDFLGLTGIGQPESMRAVVDPGAFDTIQVPFNALNPSAGYPMQAGFAETNYGNIIADCAAQRMGVFAIRVFAGGALAGRPPSAHTHRTPFFPLALYEQDQRRATRIAGLVGPARSLPEAAFQFVLAHPHVAAAIIGFREPRELEEASRWLESGPLPSQLCAALVRAAWDP